MTSIEPNQIIAEAILEKLQKVQIATTQAETTRKSILAAQAKAIADLAQSDQVFAELADQRDTLHAHLVIYAPPLSDDEIANLENTPGVIE